uniref:Non-specific lipid-transfer protein n=1 Tax=Gentiana triflora TaxID=55190 RepID=I7H3U0_GENTR|nr:lipid transfer protein homolog [Gentiana triflora]
MGKIAIKVISLVVLSMVLLDHAEGLTCGAVTSAVGPCLGFIKGAPIAPGCCPGVKSLVGLAKTTADRRAACNCLKSIANAVKPFNLKNAQNLPHICGTSVPYPIDPTINCNSVN